MGAVYFVWVRIVGAAAAPQAVATHAHVIDVERVPAPAIVWQDFHAYEL